MIIINNNEYKIDDASKYAYFFNKGANTQCSIKTDD